MRIYSGIILSLCLSVMLPSAVSARSLSVRAGGIAAGGVVDASDNSLTVSGTVDASDLHHIAVTCRSLRSLDLSEARIEAYCGDPVVTNRGEYPADELPAGSLSGLTATTLVLPAGLKTIGDAALMSAAVESIVIPPSVTSIGRGAFAGCINLKKLTVPPTVADVGSHAFKGCTAMTELDYGARCVPDGAFASCVSLRKVVLGLGVVSVGRESFNGCSSLGEVVFAGDGLTSVGDGAFASTGLTSLDLTPCTSLKSIGAYCFADCRNLEELRLPESLGRIGDGAFAGCRSLAVLALPSGITVIPPLVLKDAVSMTDLGGVLHDGITSVGTLSMAGMSGVAAVTLPATVTEIGSGAFEGWQSLGTILADKLTAVPALGSDVWLGVDRPSVELVVDREMAETFAAADQWKEFIIKIYGELSVSVPTVAGNGAGIHACLHDGVLEVEAPKPIRSVAVFGLDGRRLYSLNTEGSCGFRRSVPIEPGKVCIVSVTLADATVSAFKLVDSMQ